MIGRRMKQKIFRIITLWLVGIFILVNTFSVFGEEKVKCDDPEVLKVLRWMIVNRLCEKLPSFCPLNHWDKLAVVVEDVEELYENSNSEECRTKLVAILGHDKHYPKNEGWRGFKINSLGYEILRGMRINNPKKEEEIFVYIEENYIKKENFISIESEEKIKQLWKHLYPEEILFDYEKK